MYRSNIPIKRNNFLSNTKPQEKEKENQNNRPNDEKKDLENSNLSARSINEINYLEKKGVLDWDSNDSQQSDGEKIKKNRENFLEELNKNFLVEHTPNLNDKKESKKTLNQSLDSSKDKIEKKQPSVKKIEKKESFSNLEEEKKKRVAELTELNKKEKNLEKKLEDLTKSINSKASEIKSLESEESKKNKVLYDKDKEILKKLHELQELEAKFAQLNEKNKNREKDVQHTGNPVPLMESSREKNDLDDYDQEKVRKLQKISKKMLCFFYIEQDKKNKVLLKGKGVNIPCLEKNRYTQNLLKTQKKCDLMIYLEKPSRTLIYVVLLRKPDIKVLKHSFDLRALFKGPKLTDEVIQTTFKSVMNEIFGTLILLENKRFCIEEFLLLNQTGKPIVLGDKYELFYQNPIFSKVSFKQIVEKKGPNSEELESQINLNRKKIEEMKKFEELNRLEEEKKALENEVKARKEAKLEELRRLEELKKSEEKAAELASFSII